MKKKSIALFALTAFMTCAAAVTSFAASGWTQSGSDWEYYNASGNRVYNEWKKGADGYYRYLDGNGKMAVSTWVDDTYYVDENGIMLSDKWLKLSNDDRNDDENEYNWYYFNGSGKAINEDWKKINNKWYYFDSDNIMQTGWVLDNMYYTGEDGDMKTGWQLLLPPEEEVSQYEDDNDNSPFADDGEDLDGKKWYYFGTNGKKYVPSDMDADYAEHKVSNVYYCFDQYGAMMTGWRKIKSSEDDEIANYKLYGTDGKVTTGWLSCEPPEELVSNYEDDVEWFYFSGNGSVKTGPAEGNAKSSDIIRINNISYLFNDKGNPVSGLQKIAVGDSYTAYYFGDKSKSSVVKGKQTIEEGDGSMTDFYFADSGKGYNGVRDGKLYYMGKLQVAEAGDKYTVISLPSSNSSGHTNYVVSSSGKISKNSTVKDGNGIKYKTNSAGALVSIDGENVSSSDDFTSPNEPVWY